MNITLSLPAETEARLLALSGVAGKSPEALALEALQEMLDQSTELDLPLSLPSRLAEFESWVSSLPGGNPEADFSRDTIYGDRGK